MTPNGGDETLAGQLAREISALQASLLARLHEEMRDADAATFAALAQRLAEQFGSVTASAIRTLAEANGRHHSGIHPAPNGSELISQRYPSLFRPGQMRRRIEQLLETHRRHQHPFALLIFDIDGPGARKGDLGEGRDAVLGVVGAALRESIRLLDETFRLEEDVLCVLAPNQNTVGGVQMAERLLSRLVELEEAGGMRIGISAGVVCCPEHGSELDQLLRKADEAMWRAQAVGQPIGVGELEPLQDP